MGKEINAPKAADSIDPDLEELETVDVDPDDTYLSTMASIQALELALAITGLLREMVHPSELKEFSRHTQLSIGLKPSTDHSSANIVLAICATSLQACCQRLCHSKQVASQSEYSLVEDIPLLDEKGNDKSEQVVKAAEVKYELTDLVKQGFFKFSDPSGYRFFDKDARAVKDAGLQQLIKEAEVEESSTPTPGL